VFVCHNNQWAISVPVESQTAVKELVRKADGYGVPGVRVDGNDVLAVYRAVKEAADRARRGDGPTFVECVTYRMGGHSSSDDPSRYRDEQVVEGWRKKDPVLRFRRYLEGRGLWDEANETAAAARWNDAIGAAIKEAEAMPPPPASSMFDGVYHDLPWNLREQRDWLASEGDDHAKGEGGSRCEHDPAGRWLQARAASSPGRRSPRRRRAPRGSRARRRDAPPPRRRGRAQALDAPVHAARPGGARRLGGVALHAARSHASDDRVGSPRRRRQEDHGPLDRGESERQVVCAGWAEGSQVWYLRGSRELSGKLRLDTPIAFADKNHPFAAFDEDPPKAAIDNDGQVAVAWMTRPLTQEDGSVIAVARPNLERDGGVAITRIEGDDAGGFLLCESLDYDDDGGLVAAWIDGGRPAPGEQGKLVCAVARRRAGSRA
jgi:hypothetical protein